MSTIVREYIVNLRQEVIKAPRFKRAKRAVKALKEFVKRHLRVEEVKISNELNNYIWNRGIRKPPTKFKIVAKKENNIAYVDLAKESNEKRKENSQQNSA